MRTFTPLVAAAALVAIMCLSASVVYADEDADENADVIVGTSDNFDSLIADSQYAFVKFYAPWCGHCVRLAPIYAETATLLADEGVSFIKVDATEYGDLAANYEVRGYPTVLFFVNGVPTKYTGQRTVDGFVDWVIDAKNAATTDDL